MVGGTAWQGPNGGCPGSGPVPTAVGPCGYGGDQPTAVGVGGLSQWASVPSLLPAGRSCGWVRPGRLAAVSAVAGWLSPWRYRGGVCAGWANHDKRLPIGMFAQVRHGPIRESRAVNNVPIAGLLTGPPG